MEINNEQKLLEIVDSVIALTSISKDDALAVCKSLTDDILREFPCLCKEHEFTEYCPNHGEWHDINECQQCGAKKPETF